MAGHIPTSTQPFPETHYKLPEAAFENLREIRDDLRRMADFAAAHLPYDRELTLYRNTLAHCFEHLADRLTVVVDNCEIAQGNVR
ncbi:XAC0095 family protein [Dyella psychrodurans]|uniref:XAC0095-like domain-containing protein n=1 Tax=Dyella psychrodurans TaxID=1927960 RepID=A0A370XBZ7_9GAMM|nr:hypothetical protein [Dyella psychrodurans]RDS85790.1 hypothetical protein DWU99_00495 [Dyella psychrodurans]